MDYLKVTPEQLDAASREIQNGSNEINAINQRLMHLVLSLKDTWNGQAQQQYDAWFHQWKTNLDALNHTLGEFSGATTKAAEAYRHAESQVKGMFNV
ncbi:WXG100 family type VII secretion target [Tumebacillus permanentifrigoris]|uniref:ESAT-6-like protein n=1 Tax=Tumebacillus permanentifrigoris TaxID=378543 RepID=A0A316DBV6_9BACL|nr:WXG100 family type VII secretion target [Tumebacillus permanentifrigoris]PWK13514.1 WXG100 family type VII secretion target [Tumebacillus permanentifrigoris]